MSRALRTAQRLIRFSAVVVPGEKRTRWQREWEAELWHREQKLASGGASAFRFWSGLVFPALGSFVHSVFLRFQKPYVDPAFAQVQAADSARSENIMDQFLRDVRYAVRRLASKPAFTLVAVLSLAIGIGANTAIFSIVNAVIIRDVPLEKPEELVDVYKATAGFSHATFSYPDFEDMQRETQDVFADVAATRLIFAQTDVDGGVQIVPGELVSGNFFQLLGLRAHVGRNFTPEDDVEPGGHPVAMLGYGYWQRRYAGDPNVVGETIRLNGMAYTIIGVTPKAYGGNVKGLTPEVYAPMMMVGHLNPSDFNELEARGSQNIWAKARVIPGVTFAQAQAAIDRVGVSFRERYPDNWQAQNVMTVVASNDVIMNPMIDKILVPAAGMLMVVVGLVLLIACANLASFLLAQVTDRRKEIAVRLAMGARRGRLVRQMLTESMMLALVGGLAGIAVAVGLLEALLTADLPLPFPISLDLSLDPVVLGFSLAVTLGAGFLFGLAPALQATKAEVAPTLRDESAGGGGRRKLQVRNVLVVTQVAVSVMLLVGAGLFLRSLQARVGIDPGFGQSPAAIVTLQTVPDRYTEEEANVFFRTLLEDAAAIPGVTAVGMSGDLPLSALNNQMMGVTVDGVSPPPGENFHSIDWAEVDPGYFDALGIPIVAGRPFDEGDNRDGAQVVIVSEAMGSLFWPGKDPIGQTFRRDTVEYTIVGLARDVKHRSLGEAFRPFVFRPYAQSFSSSMTVVATTSGDASSTLLDLMAVARRIDPEIMLYETKTMERHMAVMLLPHRLAAFLVGAFGAVGLLLASIGLYGIVSYSVSTRAREMSIRLALGAEPGRVVRLLLGGGMRLVAVGGVVGIGLSLVFARLLGSLLYGVTATDPVALVLVPLLLAAVAFVAAWIPARRAGWANLVEALKAE